MRAFAAELAAVPRSAEQLREWGQLRKYSMAKPPAAATNAAIAAFQAERADAGLPALPVCARGAHRVKAAGGTGDAGPARRTHEWKKPEVIAGMARAIRILGFGKQLTQDRLKQIAKENPGRGIPSWSSVDRRREHPGETWQVARSGR